MSVAFLITTLVTVLLALVGYVLTYRNNLRLTQRQERLVRLGRQLSEFYGPLLAISEANEIAWKRFRAEYRHHTPSFFDLHDPPTEPELEAWRLWMTKVFIPNNRRLYDLVISKADLLVDDEMPSSMLHLCAHVSAYEVVLHRWEQGDFSEHTALINYPFELDEYAKRMFRRLKAEQLDLLGYERPKSSDA